MYLRSTPRRSKDGSKVRVVENAYRHTWPNLRRELDRLHVGTITGPADTFHQRTEIVRAQRDGRHAPTIDTPSRINQVTPTVVS